MIRIRLVNMWDRFILNLHFILHTIGFIKTINRNGLYVKQPEDSTICFPVSLYNAILFQGKRPPRLNKLIRIFDTDEDGTAISDISRKVMNKYGLFETKDVGRIIKKGGIIFINGNLDRIAKMIGKMVLDNRKGIYNVGEETKTMHALALETNPEVEPTMFLPVEGMPTDVTMDLTKYKG